jgi:hypothetical protein
MAHKEEFEIIVTPDGQIKIKAMGFKGTTCMQPLKQVGEIIAPGVAPIREEKQAEYYQKVEDQKKVTGETRDE